MATEIGRIFGEWLAVTGVAAAAILSYGGLLYVTSAGDPERMATAKRVLYGAVVGLIVVAGAATLSGAAREVFKSPGGQTGQQEFEQAKKQEFECKGNLVEASVCGLVRQLVTSAVEVVDRGLEGVLAGTSLPSSNPGLVQMWGKMLGVGYGLLVILIALIGFGIMGAEFLGLPDFSFGTLVKRLGLGLVAANVSLYLVDLPIRVSNTVTGEVLGQDGGGLLHSFFKSEAFGSLDGSLFLVVLALVAVVMGVVLLVFYAVRHIVIALVAVLAPVLFILAIVPRLGNLLNEVGKMYLGLVMVTVVHAVLIRLAVVLLTASNLPVFLNYFAAVALMYILVKTPSIGMAMFASETPMNLAKSGGQQVVNRVSSWMTTIRQPKEKVAVPAVVEPKKRGRRRKK